MRTALALPLALSAALLGCERPHAPAGPAAAATADLVTTVTTTAVPPAPAPAAPAATLIRSAVAVEAARRLPLSPATEVVVDPGATFELELSARAPDARLVLVDVREDLVASSGARELTAGTKLTLAPSAPLVPGSRYALRLDGASGREFHDDAGRVFAPLTLPVVAAGTPPPPQAKRKKPSRRRHP